MRNTLWFLHFLLLSSIFGGCATLFKNTDADYVSFSSTPNNAKIYVNGTYRGVTPIEIKLSANKNHEIKVEKAGFSTAYYNIDNKIGAKWIILNVLAGTWPIVIDAVTGNWYELDQSDVSIALNKE